MVLYNLVRDIYANLGQLRAGVVQSGTTTTIVDNKLIGKPTDHFKYHTVLIDYDAGGAEDAPENEFREVSSYAPSTGTLTVGTAFSVAPAAGDRYALAGSLYQLDDVLMNINTALRAMGSVPLQNTSLVGVTGQTEYATPAGVDPEGITEIWMATSSDANDQEPIKLSNWYIRSDATYPIIFRTMPDVGSTIILVYNGIHPDVWLAADTLKTSVHPVRLMREVVYALRVWKQESTDDVSDAMINRINMAAKDLENARKEHPIHRTGTDFFPILTRGSEVERSNKYGPFSP